MTLAGTAPRAHVVDLIRLVMSLQMIQGHVIDALIDRALRTGPVFEAWTWVRGLTAVGFLIAAGLAFHLSSLARWDAYRADRAARKRRVRRALMLIAIGYALHAPAGLLSGDPELARASIAEAQIVDVLQCIGLTMLLLEAAVSIATSARQVLIACAIGSIACIGLAPWAARIGCEASAVRALCNYLSTSGGSLFPLLPWSGFLLGGVVLGAIALPEGAATPGARGASRLAGVSAIAIAASVALSALERFEDPAAHAAAPSFALLRLGCVAGVAAALALASARTDSLPRPLRTLAGETLVLYVTHLLILYVAGVGLARVIGPSLPAATAIGVAAIVLATSVTIALGWARWRDRRRIEQHRRAA